MDNLFRSLQKSIILDVRAWVLALQLLPSATLLAKDAKQPAKHETKMVSQPHQKEPEKLMGLLDSASQSQETYTINLNNISIIEYIRFISRITGINFVFDEKELGFSITVVSEEPLNVSGVISALVQTLRVHNMHLIEQDGNVIVTRNTLVNQIPTVVSVEVPAPSDISRHPLVTRVFRIHNAKPSTLASLIKPLCSAAAVIESSQETNQLIVTDIPVNIDQISDLLSSLDIPHTPFEIDTYTTKYVLPQKLIDLVNKILSPLSQGNSLLLVPQSETGKVFIISTPHLVQRALVLFEDLDVHPEIKSDTSTTSYREIYLYKIKNQTHETLVQSLKEIGKQLENSNPVPVLTIQAINAVQWIPESNSLLFNTDPETNEKIEKILLNLDVLMEGQFKVQPTQLFFYKLKYADEKKIKESLKTLAEKSGPDTAARTQLLKAIETAQWVPDADSFLFDVQPSQQETLKQFLDLIDVPGSSNKKVQQAFFLYPLKYADGEKLLEQVQHFGKELSKSESASPEILQGIKTLRYMPENNTLLISAPADAIEEIKKVISQFDTPQNQSMMKQSSSFEIYKIKYVDGDKLLDNLSKFADDLKKTSGANHELINTLKEARYVKENNSLILSGSPTVLAQSKAIVMEYDSPDRAEKIEARETFEIYAPKYLTAKKLKESLTHFALDLAKTKGGSPALITSLEDARYVEENNTLILSGTPAVLAEVKHIISTLDSQHTSTQMQAARFEIYPIQYVGGKELLQKLHEFASQLKKTKGASKEVIETLEELRFIEESNSLLIDGTPAAVEEVKTIIARFDSPGARGTLSREETSTVELIPIVNAPGDRILEEAKNFANELSKTKGSSKSLIETLETLRYVPASRSIIASGKPSEMAQVKMIVQGFDVVKPADKNFVLYSLKFSHGQKMVDRLEEFADEVERTPGVTPELLHTLRSVRFIEESNQLVISGTKNDVDRTYTIVEQFDTENQGMPKGPEVFSIYTLRKVDGGVLIQQLDDFRQKLSKSKDTSPSLLETLKKVQWIKENNTILITGPQESVEQVRKIIEQFDDTLLPMKAARGSEIFVLYPLQYADGKELIEQLEDFDDRMKSSPGFSPELYDAIRRIQLIEENNNLVLTGPVEIIDQIKGIIGQFDVPQSKHAKEKMTFAMYAIQHIPGEQLEKSLQDFKAKLKKSKAVSPEVIETIDSLKWIRENNSLFISGPESAVNEVKGLLAQFDTPTALHEIPDSEVFALFSLQNHDWPTMEKKVEDFSSNLRKSQSPPEGLLKTLSTLRFLRENNSILITGSQVQVDQATHLLTQFDQIDAREALALRKNMQETYTLYKLKYTSGKQLLTAMKRMVSELSADDPMKKDLSSSLDKAKFVSENNSVMFQGSPDVIEQLISLAEKFDLPGLGNESFEIVELKFAKGSTIIKQLENLALKLDDTPAPNMQLLRGLRGVQWVEETNTLLVTGSPEIVAQIKGLIAKYDVQTAEELAAQKGEKGSFFVYRPVNRSGKELRAQLIAFKDNLKNSGLEDASLIRAIEKVQYVPTTDSLVITATPTNIEKIKDILIKLDQPVKSTTQLAENLTFLMYKAQFATIDQIGNMLKGVALDLEKSKISDPNLLSAIRNLKKIKESNSILFTGTPESLKKIEELLQKFDTSDLGRQTSAQAPSAPMIERPATNEFMLYRPQYQSGPELITTLQDFRSNLSDAGVVDKSLFDTIDNLKYVERTGSILVSGSPPSIARVDELLKRFDFPVEGAETPLKVEADETNFLVYKLQYHQGEDLVASLKSLGKKFETHPSEGTRLMAQAISTIQWIQITNSLLASGEPEVLKKLRYLIQNLDIPLKQVLIEVLVIETSIENSTQFGVDWAAAFQYRNKFAQSITNKATDGLSNAVNALNPIASSPTFPLVADVPQAADLFNLGVIGDIIMHKGKSFLSMGALINALQSDAESSIITNPKIIAQDNRTSSIFNGQSIPFVGSVVSNQSANTVVSSSLEYRDIGFNLTLTPVIGVNNLVTLEINNSISSTVGSTEIDTTTVNGITSTSNTMTTKVSVPNEHFVIISGILTDSRSVHRSSIPCLGGLPMVGAAFRNISRVGTNKGFVIFLRPVVLDHGDDFYKITDYEKDLWKDQIGVPSLQEQFDEVIDRIDIDKIQ